MPKLIVINSKTGGVGSIISKITNVDPSTRILELKNNGFLANIFTLLANKYTFIEFHQPRAFLYSLLYKCILFYRKHTQVIILHECSNYTFGSVSYAKSILGTITRFVLLWLNFFSGVEIYSVSAYISKSYLGHFSSISYVRLFKTDLELNPIIKFNLKNNSAIIWLRKGYANTSLDTLILLTSYKQIESIYIFGDQSETEILKRTVANHPQLVNICIHDFPNIVDHYEYLKIINSCKYFISMYPMEGYGLSIFFAMYYGCIVLSNKMGGFVDWLPISNFTYLDGCASSSSTSESVIHSDNKINAQKMLTLQ